MISFDQVWEITDNFSTEFAFHREECKALYDIAASLPRGSTIVEIGCEYGRSTSVLAQVSNCMDHYLICIDPFGSPDIATSWLGLMHHLGTKLTLHMMKSCEAPINPYDLILVDGDHSRNGVEVDCFHVAEAHKGSYACFHDYGPTSLPDVYPTVNKFMRQQNKRQQNKTRYCDKRTQWKELPTIGTLGIWRLEGESDD